MESMVSEGNNAIAKDPGNKTGQDHVADLGVEASSSQPALRASNGTSSHAAEAIVRFCCSSIGIMEPV